LILRKKEIKEAIFSIGNDRAPGPDGFTSAFFKKPWQVIGEDVCRAIQDFFIHSRLLQEVNHTIIALIPKVSTPGKVTDFRPISCCNVLYKCISKINANRIKGALDEIVRLNQSAFVFGRKIFKTIFF